MRNRLMPVVAAAGLLGLIGGSVGANAGTDITSRSRWTSTSAVIPSLGRAAADAADTLFG
jgi:hypothetical protein